MSDSSTFYDMSPYVKVHGCVKGEIRTCQENEGMI